MIEAKITGEEQITIPEEIMRQLRLNAGDTIVFDVDEKGVHIRKSLQPLTIQERFANSETNQSNEEVSKSMKELDTGMNFGEEKII